MCPQCQSAAPIHDHQERDWRHWVNIRTYFTHRITNAGAEAINAKIRAAKRRACGFRSRVRFRTASYFHCGGLDLYPASLIAVS